MITTTKRYELRRNPDEDWEGSVAYAASEGDVADAVRWVVEETGAVRHDWDSIARGWDAGEYFMEDSECVRMAEGRLLEGYPEGAFLDCDTEGALVDALWPQFEGWDED